jgi:hypothetical protein
MYIDSYTNTQREYYKMKLLLIGDMIGKLILGLTPIVYLAQQASITDMSNSILMSSQMDNSNLILGQHLYSSPMRWIQYANLFTYHRRSLTSQINALSSNSKTSSRSSPSTISDKEDNYILALSMPLLNYPQLCKYALIESYNIEKAHKNTPKQTSFAEDDINKSFDETYIDFELKAINISEQDIIISSSNEIEEGEIDEEGNIKERRILYKESASGLPRLVFQDARSTQESTLLSSSPPPFMIHVSDCYPHESDINMIVDTPLNMHKTNIIFSKGPLNVSAMDITNVQNLYAETNNSI